MPCREQGGLDRRRRTSECLSCGLSFDTLDIFSWAWDSCQWVGKPVWTGCDPVSDEHRHHCCQWKGSHSGSGWCPRPNRHCHRRHPCYDSTAPLLDWLASLPVHLKHRKHRYKSPAGYIWYFCMVLYSNTQYLTFFGLFHPKRFEQANPASNTHEMTTCMASDEMVNALLWAIWMAPSIRK